MNLPNDISRCNGVFPMGGAVPTFACICPRRETCERYLQIERDRKRLAAGDAWASYSSGLCGEIGIDYYIEAKE